MIGLGAAAGPSGTADEIDTGDVVADATPEVDGTSGVVDGASTTTRLTATVAFVSVLPAVVEDDPDELAAVDEEVLGLPVRCRVFVSLVVVSLPAVVVDDDWPATVSVAPELLT
jgi:hypothetical protein